MKLVKKLNKKFEQGLTLIEASMVLALSAVVISGAVMYYNSASENNKLQRAQALLANIQSSVQTLYGARSERNGLTSQVLANSGQIPNVFIDKTATPNKLITPWASTIEVDALTGGKGYTVIFSDLSVFACQAMAVLDLGNTLEAVTTGTDASTTKTSLALPAILTTASTAGETDIAPGAAAGKNIQKANVAVIQGACTSSTAGGLMSLGWRFKV